MDLGRQGPRRRRLEAAALESGPAADVRRGAGLPRRRRAHRQGHVRAVLCVC